VNYFDFNTLRCVYNRIVSIGIPGGARHDDFRFFLLCSLESTKVNHARYISNMWASFWNTANKVIMRTFCREGLRITRNNDDNFDVGLEASRIFQQLWNALQTEMEKKVPILVQKVTNFMVHLYYNIISYIGDCLYLLVQVPLRRVPGRIVRGSLALERRGESSGRLRLY
jgi:hypothetical protein